MMVKPAHEIPVSVKQDSFQVSLGHAAQESETALQPLIWHSESEP